ncbi:MAG: hypothetical protein MZV64_07660 [Ignavibacteriales bacterium]|nr:hypothetical protein [Ignavibacteriales bacterium]
MVLGEIKTKKRYPIHQSCSMLSKIFQLQSEMFETGIKVIDLIEPYTKGGKTGLFGGAGVGKTVIIQELIHNIASAAWWLFCILQELVKELVKEMISGLEMKESGVIGQNST